MTTLMVWAAAGALWLGCLVPTAWPVSLVGLSGIGVAGLALRGSGRFVGCVAAMALVGSGVAGARVDLLDSGVLADLATTGGTAQMTGIVVTEARDSSDGAWLLVRLETVDGRRSGRRALLRVDDLDQAPPLAATVGFAASARPLDREGFDGYLRRLHAGVEVYPAAGPEVIRPPPGAVAATTVVRERVRAAAGRYLPTDHAALLSGLVTGDTTGLSESARDNLLAAGLTHLVAVSGSNVALVLAGTVGLAALAGIGARGRRRLAVAALVWFVVLVRAEPSVLRASVMAGLVLSAAALGRGHDARHTLGVTVLLLLLVDPMLAGQLGFALSVLATGGVLIGTPLIAPRIPGPRSFSTSAAASIGAQLGVAPVLITTDGGVSLGALPANLIAVPMAAVASAVGVAAALLAQVSAAAGGAVSATAWPVVSVILWAGEAFSSAPAITAAHLATPSALLLAVALAVRRRSPRVAALTLVVVVVTTVRAPWASAPDVATLTLTMLDVGQGDAILVEVPGAGGAPPARMLVDGGPEDMRAARLLRSRGVRYLDVVVATHPHADHTDGLPAVLSRTPTGAVFVGPASPDGLEDPAASALALEVVAGQQRVPITRVAAGQRFALGRAHVEILSPPADGSLGRDPNDNSVVLRVTDGDDSLLLTGDAEVAAQSRLLRRPDLLRADVLKVPHHGGNTNAEGFVEAVGARTAVIGVGADNDYGHPHPDVLADLAGTQVVRTDTSGTVTVPIE